jgi:hypothetical protein
MVDGSTVLRVPDPVLMRKVHDEVVLLDMASEQYFGLDAVGACVIEAIQAALTSTVPSLRCSTSSMRRRIRSAPTSWRCRGVDASGLLVVTSP